MRGILVILLIGILLMGCTTPPENGANGTKSNVTNATNNTNQTGPPVQIIIGQQKNQTTEQNLTQPTPNVTENVSGPTYRNDPNQSLGIYFIDVSDIGLHGDAILIKKGDLDVLVDAGPVEKAGKVVDLLRSKGVDDVDLLISTNADPRHYGGIGTVADNFKVESFWWTGDDFDDATYKALAARMKGVEIVQDGSSMELNGINFTVLNPPKSDRFSDVNNDAIVLRVTDRNFSILLTSGIQTGAQGLLINQKKEQIKTDLMQAPYYGVGSGTSNIGLMLVNAHPTAIIISGSADESAANGGSREPFERLMTQYGIKWHENYVNGTIKVSSDGQGYAIESLGKGQ